MRFRNPVEYLSNPPEQVLSVDEFFRLQCIRARSLIMDQRLGRLFIWRERGIWLVRYSCLRPHLQEEYVGSLGGQGSKLSEAVESAFANKYAKDYVKSVLAPADDKQVEDLVRLILLSLDAERARVYERDLSGQIYSAVSVGVLDDGGFSIRTYYNFDTLRSLELERRRGAYYGSAQPFVGATLEEALLAAAAAAYGGGA